VVKILQ